MVAAIIGISCNVEIRDTVSFGRVLHSRSSFSVGEVVFAESPILLSLHELSSDEEMLLARVSEDTGLQLVEDFKFLKSFCLSDECSRKKVLDCYAPPRLEVSRSRLLTALLGVVPLCSRFHWGSGVLAETLEKVVLVKACNAHGFFSQDNGCAALYTFGSKMRHSCSPNVVYTSQREPGMGSFVAKSDIRAGDELFISYITVQRSEPMRRAQLEENYLFRCLCKLCTTGIDIYRGIKCGCGDTLFHDRETDSWKCGNCGNTSCPVTPESESQLVKESLSFLDSFRVEIRGQLIELLERLYSILGPHHACTKLLEKSNIEHHFLSSFMVVDRYQDEIISITDSILNWSKNDPDFLDSTLLEIACALGRVGQFEKALHYLTILKKDMDLVFGPIENEPTSLVRRALHACSSRDADSVPDLIMGSNLNS